MPINDNASITHSTDKSFNLTEYYALKSVKLSDSYTVKFEMCDVYYDNDGEDNSGKDSKEVDVFYCERIKLPTIKNEVVKLDAGSMGNKFSTFAHKPFDEVTLTLLEDDDSSVYKFIIDRISQSYCAYSHTYKVQYNGMDKYIPRLDCTIFIYDNSFTKIKMKVVLNNCKIVNYNTSTFNSNDTSTPYMYDITMSFEGLKYVYGDDE